MKNKFISITILMAAFSVFAIMQTTTTTITNVQAYTTEELNYAAVEGSNVAKIANIASLTMNTCTSQITMSDLSNVDACMSFTKIFDKYMSLAVAEANGNIKQITGFEVTK